ncbi:hypothetical protein MOV76_35735 [Rhizobium sp. PRIMUS64]|uniref:hypothetical protein n=1 Tax=Rhizobium sp. PRIMUS64 TaxID=2908925 RepID=UPI001FF324E3|nr:hypothetical protein [Rhizobium sp. PRIMUS64]MCJ9696917.1 hypothetical protein [Rhizobium sp. PRIMUS64]
MEKEFSKISTEMQELRRDVDRTVNVPFGEEPFQILPGTVGQVPVFDDNGNLIPGTPAGGGNMFREIYDPQDFGEDIFQFVLDHLVSVPAYVETRTALKALDTTKNTVVFLKEAGREGIFKWTVGDFASRIAADTAEAIYVKADAIAAAAGGWVRIFNGSADLRWFGAAGDGATNDTTAVNAAFASGVSLSGRKLTYAVSGNITIPSGLHLEDATFKQLTPNNASRRTLYADTVSNVTLKRVKVDRNGNGTFGSLGTAAGIYLKSVTNLKTEDIEAFGADMGTGIVFDGCTDFCAVRPYAHDITYTSASLPADDQAQGIWFQNCRRFSVVNAVVRHVGGIVGGSFRRAFGRMMPFGLGCVSFAVIGGILSDGDVGIDLTGSVGNRQFSLYGVTVEDVETWGIKLANYNRFGFVTNCNVYRAGSAGFVGSGPTLNVDAGSPTPESLPQHVTFTACGAWDTGYGNTGRGTSQPAGFLVAPGGASNFQDYPRGYRMVNCVAYDNQAVKTQYHGFRNEISYGGAPLNECVGCRADGFASGGSGFSGWHFPMAAVSRSTAQVLTNNIAGGQEITFDTERSDGAAMHSPGVPGRISVPRAGFYLITGKGTFQQNVTGMRSLSLTLNGVVQPAINDVQPGSSANDTTCRFSEIVYIGDLLITIGMNAYQNAGGNLNISNCTLTVAEIMPNQVNG